MISEQTKPQVPQALRSRVIVKLTGNGYTTTGGIIIQSTDVSNRATVISVGEGVDEVNVGDEVLFNVHAAKDMDFNGDAYLSLNINDIYGSINNPEQP